MLRRRKIAAAQALMASRHRQSENNGNVSESGSGSWRMKAEKRRRDKHRKMVDSSGAKLKAGGESGENQHGESQT